MRMASKRVMKFSEAETMAEAFVEAAGWGVDEGRRWEELREGAR